MLRIILLLALPAVALAQQTVAEKTDYRSTSRHADVVAFGEELVRKAPGVVRLTDIGKSGEGRSLPMLILANPPVSNADEAAKSNRLVVMTFANIHAGEVDGKEAALMLARDIATGADRALLKELVILVVPILNADGNERIDPRNRTEQNGPPGGVGIRANAAGYDLNRDFVKLETPEVQALARTVNHWDPAVVVDLHTTNGSYHRYALTYDGPRYPAAHPDLIAAVRDKWLPEIGAAMEKETGYKSFFYGNFTRDRAAWESYPALPRYGVQWLALRNRIGLLSESYSNAPFKDRVLASQAFTRTIFRHVADRPAEVRKLLGEADRPRDRIPVRTKTVSLGERTILGFVEEMKDGRRVPTREPKDHRLPFLAGVEQTVVVQRPYAYLLPASSTVAVETLQRHGIAVEELSTDAEVDLQVYRIEKVTRAERVFQKHNLVTLEVARRAENRKLPAGTVLVRTDQRLGTLAAYLLEPEAEDGLATWNLFDAALAEGKDFSVLRLPKESAMSRRPLPTGKERR